jgi:Undecaprenyl-phosphate galactose phosphotransferase WbaP
MSIDSAPAPLRRGLAFLAGMGFAALPTLGPFVALLALLSSRIELSRSDRWWWAAALLLAVPYALGGFAAEGALDALQVLAVWLIFRSASLLRRSLRDSSIAVDVGTGLLVGLVVALAVGLRQLGTLRPEAALTLLDAVIWQSHPALFAHSLLVLAALLGIVVPNARLRAVALALGALAVVLAGAREALIAWLLIAIALRFVSRRGDRVTRAVEWSTIAVMLVLVTGLGGLLGLGRPGFLVDVAREGASPNLFRGTEAVDGDWWHALQVRYVSQPVQVAGTPRTGFRVSKTGSDPWARLQQLVTLEPGKTYTLSAALAAPAAQRPGLDGWGNLGRDGTPAIVSTTLADGVLRGTATGAIELLGTAVDLIDPQWSRAAVRFRYLGDAPLVWYTGVVVDRRPGSGSQLTFAELQLVEGTEVAAYAPGGVGRGVMDLRTTRFPIWRDALTAIGARPWLGWGPGGLPRAVDAELPGDARLRPVAAHAHNLLLTTGVERGIVGVVGVLLLLGLLALRAVQQRDRPAVIVILGVVVLNVFDASLLSAGVIYPLAAVLGWRAVGHRQLATSETGIASATGVRVALALADVAAAALAVTVALTLDASADGPAALARAWSPALFYALLAWPAFAGLAGLYPGYGLPRAEELARVVRAATAAGAAFAFVTQVFRDAFTLPLGTALLVIPLVLVLAPVMRWSTKWLLRKALVWGRPVVILGAGARASQVVRYLTQNPGIGLRPVATFGSGDPGRIAGTPHLGEVADAWPYLDAQAIRHVIVSPEAAAELDFDEVLRKADTRLQYVQFLPDLHGLPATSVVAAPLGVTLGLEVRNQLASGTNRAVKRALDLLGSVVLLVVLAPLLLALALWIRLDSRGPALYVSPRIGRHGRHFGCVKFRTMHVDAEERLQQLLAEDPAARAEYEHYHKLADDPRVTRAGALLRSLSLDELPQLFNVFAGHMSLVGPRPYLVREYDQLGPNRDLIFLARPGMTGYWQIDGRNDVSFEERQAMEADYVRNWSVWWDIDLLLRTPAVVLDRTGK